MTAIRSFHKKDSQKPSNKPSVDGNDLILKSKVKNI